MTPRVTKSFQNFHCTLVAWLGSGVRSYLLRLTLLFVRKRDVCTNLEFAFVLLWVMQEGALSVTDRCDCVCSDENERLGAWELFL